MRKTFLSLSFVLLLLASFNIYATWSVIAVDRETGEIGIAGASCTSDVQGIASIVPGKGAIVVQAASSWYAKMTGVDLMNEGASASEVLEVMRDEKFEPEKQQYGVIVLSPDQAPIVDSGSLISEWHGSKAGEDFAVLGNILVGEKVVSDAFEAFDANRSKPLHDRLMLALSAGAEAGGDKRCGDQKARSAFVSVYDPETGSITRLAVYGIEPGGQPAVELLRMKANQWKKEGQNPLN